MGLVQKVIAGGPKAKSRLHSLDGDLLDLAGLRYLPRAVLSTLGRKLFGHRPGVPWLGYRAIRYLDGLLQADWQMIEFGSGMSTVWFAKRVNHVYSIEDYAPWYEKVKVIFDKFGVNNVTYKLLTESDYANADFVSDQSMDFVLVDGSQRDACMRTALKKIKPGGWIYLDNADQEANDRKIARRLLLDQVQARGGSYQYFVDFAPTYVIVTKGLLAQVGEPT
jgi:predicted O-methyltransferase YrrM